VLSDKNVPPTAYLTYEAAKDSGLLPPTEAEITDRIVTLAGEIDDLYKQRAGMMHDDTRGWCSSCGREWVYPHEGEDTCRWCLGDV
jgi:hypothetical protein